MAAELCKGRWSALIVACGAQEIVEDLQDGGNVAARTTITVLTVRVQSACRRREKEL